MEGELLSSPNVEHTTVVIDVLVPTYRPTHSHLTVALTSLQRQTCADWRCFIHDDAVPESESASIVRPFLADHRIRFQSSHRRLGIGGNWNACLGATHAPFVAFLFQDDLWEPTYLGAALDVLTHHPSVGVVSMRHTYAMEGREHPIYQEVQDVRSTFAPGLYQGQDFLRLWLERGLRPNIIGEPSFVVLRRSVMEDAGFFLTNMSQALDTEYWLRMLLRSDWYHCADQSYGSFRVHPQAASAQTERDRVGLFDRLRCFNTVIASGDPSLKTLAKRSKRRAFLSMMNKFFVRIFR